MLITTSPVTVLSRSTYSDPDEQDPNRRVVWGASMGAAQGQLIEKIVAYDPATQAVFDNLTLDPSINGECTPMATVKLRVEVVREQKPARSGSGREYIAVKDKWRVVGVEPVAAPKG